MIKFRNKKFKIVVIKCLLKYKHKIRDKITTKDYL